MKKEQDLKRQTIVAYIKIKSNDYSIERSFLTGEHPILKQ